VRRVNLSDRWRHQCPMVLKLKIAAFVLLSGFGLWLAFNNVEPKLPYSSWNCAGSRALFCLQR
jgi:hypothetical protein